MLAEKPAPWSPETAAITDAIMKVFRVATPLLHAERRCVMKRRHDGAFDIHWAQYEHGPRYVMNLRGRRVLVYENPAAAQHWEQPQPGRPNRGISDFTAWLLVIVLLAASAGSMVLMFEIGHSISRGRTSQR